jgi:hypothetical protein
MEKGSASLDKAREILNRSSHNLDKSKSNNTENNYEDNYTENNNDDNN